MDGERLWAYRRQLGAVARHRLCDPSLADDVVQEALLRAFRDAATIEEARCGAWLTAVAQRLAVDESRRRKYVEVRADPADKVVDDDDPAAIVEQRELLRQVQSAIHRLPSRQRRLLLRQLAGGLSIEQLAADEQTSVASVRSVLARARAALRASLHDTGWLVAGSVTRIVTTVESGIQRLVRRAEHAASRMPRLSREVPEALTALFAAAALAMTPSATGGQRPSTATTASDEIVVPSPTATAPTPELPQLVDLEPPALPEAEDLVPPGATLPVPLDDEGTKTIPFAEMEGEIQQFAVAPDERTVLASGGWVETPGSMAGNTVHKEWEGVLYRSTDGGHRWQRTRGSGFQPGRVLFAPAWPVDQRVFVVTDRSVLRSTDGGHTFSPIQPGAHDPGSIVPAIKAASDEQTDGIYRSDSPPPAPTLRPGVLSPGFSEGDERIFMGAPAEVFDVRVGTTEPLVSLPPWKRSHGVAPAPDHDTSDAVLVGGTVRSGMSSEQAALFRCAGRECTKLHVFDEASDPPGVFVSPKDRNLVYVWTTYGAHRSVDGGRTWHRQTVGPVVDLVEVRERLVFLSRSGIPMSDDRGVTWRQLHVLYSLSAVAPIGDRHLLIASGLGVACSPDGGDTWLERCA